MSVKGKSKIFDRFDYNPTNPAPRPPNRNRIVLHKAARRVAALRRHDPTAPAYRYHKRLRFGRLAVERGLPEAGRILAAGG